MLQFFHGYFIGGVAEYELVLPFAYRQQFGLLFAMQVDAETFALVVAVDAGSGSPVSDVV